MAPRYDPLSSVRRTWWPVPHGYAPAMSSGVGLLARGRQSVRQHAVALDVLVAIALTAAALGAVATLRHDATVPLTVIAAAACTTTVAWRRIAAVPAALVALTAIVAYQISGQDTQGSFISLAIVMICYMAGRAVTSRWLLAAVAGYGLAACTTIVVDDGFSLGKDMLTWLPLIVLPIVAGAFVRRRDGIVRQLRDTRSQLQGERDIARARGRAEERTRIARELHDVVAHCVSVMVIQAGAARLLTDSDVVAARDAMRVVAASGREALTDLRRVVGVRRRGEDAFAASPLGLGQVPQLVERTRAAGTVVRLHLDAAASLPADVDLAAFRIVQEALTNVRKHAPAAVADVRVAVCADSVDIVVTDSGPAAPPAVDGSGNGLVGMQERVAVHGGELTAAPTQDGGFRVHARLPMTPAPEAVAPAATPPDRRVSRRRPTPLQWDALFSVAWLVVLEVQAVTSTHRSGPLALDVVAVGLMALAGLIRRRLPLAFLVIVGGLTLALSGGIADPQRASAVGTYTLLVGTYTVAAYCGTRRSAIGLSFVLAGVVVATVVQHAPAGTAFGGALMSCVVWIAGRVIRNQRELVAELRRATTNLAAERDTRTVTARYEERVRIARDLHAIIARLVSGMVVQAEAADELLGADPVAAAAAIGEIEQTGRD